MSGHPLQELAADLMAAATDIDNNRRVGSGNPVRDGADVLLALHPDVARCALALAEGAVVPDGWALRMSDRGWIEVVEPWNGGSLHLRPHLGMDDLWLEWRKVDTGYRTTGRGVPFQAAVDAAVAAIDGTTGPRSGE